MGVGEALSNPSSAYAAHFAAQAGTSLLSETESQSQTNWALKAACAALDEGGGRASLASMEAAGFVLQKPKDTDNRVAGTAAIVAAGLVLQDQTAHQKLKTMSE